MAEPKDDALLQYFRNELTAAQARLQRASAFDLHSLGQAAAEYLEIVEEEIEAITELLARLDDEEGSNASTSRPTP